MADSRDHRKKDTEPAQDAQSDAPQLAADSGDMAVDAADLRRRAEGLLDEIVDGYVDADISTPTREGLAYVVQELRVHEVELEMQNEELRRAQLELDDQRQKYFDLFDLAPVGYLTISSKGMVADANLTAAALLGVDRAALLGAPLSRFATAEGADAYYLRIRQLTTTSEPQDFELQFRRGDGAFWARVQARPQSADSISDECQYRLTFSDIGDLEAERSMAQRLKAVIESSHDIIYAIDANGVFLYVSPSWELVLGHDPSTVVGRSFEEFTHPDDVPRCRAGTAEVVANSRTHVDVEYRARHADGTWRWLESKLAPAFDARGEVTEYVGNARDITKLKSDLERLQTMAMTDELTGIGNRRQLLAAAATEFERARRHGNELSLLLTDLDHLKGINDSFGHDTGDRALQIVAEICERIGRGADAAGRLGGDEFGILLPHSDGAAALEVGERLRRQVEQEPGAGRLPEGMTLTVSVGLSTVQPEDTDYTGMLKRADRALYRAKETGRNRTCM